MKSVQLFTTPIVQGLEIESYHGVVVANQVAGTGFFSDFAASFSDVFGGTSGTYRRQMNDLCDNVMDQLRDKASVLGANGVVGVSIDYDEISGKGVSMFMISVHGTAVRFAQQQQEMIVSEGTVSREQLDRHLKSYILSKKLKEHKYPSQAEWNYIFSHQMAELAPALQEFMYYLRDKGYVNGPEGSGFSQNYNVFIGSLPYKDAIELAYSRFIEIPAITEYHLFNAAKVLKYIKADFAKGIELLATDKDSYRTEDLAEMQELAEYLKNLPNKGRMEYSEGGLFSSKGMKFVCSCGCKNNETEEFCTNCGHNIKGFDKKQAAIIDEYLKKVEILEELLQ